MLHITMHSAWHTSAGVIGQPSSHTPNFFSHAHELHLANSFLQKLLFHYNGRQSAIRHA